MFEPCDPDDCFLAFEGAGCTFPVFESVGLVGFADAAGADFCMLSGVRAGSRCWLACEGTAAARKRTKATTATK